MPPLAELFLVDCLVVLAELILESVVKVKLIRHLQGKRNKPRGRRNKPRGMR